MKDKEIVYHSVRQDFSNGKAKSNKHRIRELEAEVKELEMAGADGDYVDDGGSHQTYKVYKIYKSYKSYSYGRQPACEVAGWRKTFYKVLTPS